VLHAGATIEEAEDAASDAMTDMVRIWPVRGNPLAYACTAAIRYFIKARKRPRALVRRIKERDPAAWQPGAEDQQLTGLEDSEWTAAVMAGLTSAQREVMQCIADGVDRDEIAEALGITKAAARRRLCDARARLVQILSPDGEFKHPRPPTAREAL
jgi:RNA polymerase sigma factor (sigma-70 family)